MNLEKREQELKNLLRNECADPTRVDVINIVNLVMEEVAATKKDT